jgi:hypothetical protein
MARPMRIPATALPPGDCSTTTAVDSEFVVSAVTTAHFAGGRLAA